MDRSCILVLLALAAQGARFGRTGNPDLPNEELVLKDDEFIPRPADNWQDEKSLQEAMKHLYVYKVGADVTFIVTDQTGIAGLY